MLDIDWSKVPEGYDHAAQDFGSPIYAYQEEPMIGGAGNPWWYGPYSILIGNTGENLNWRDTLTHRPAKTAAQPSPSAPAVEETAIKIGDRFFIEVEVTRLARVAEVDVASVKSIPQGRVLCLEVDDLKKSFAAAPAKNDEQLHRGDLLALTGPLSLALSGGNEALAALIRGMAAEILQSRGPGSAISPCNPLLGKC